MLGKEDKIRYKEKVTFSDGTTITDPYGLSNNWKNDVSLLPDISWVDIYFISHLKLLNSLYATMFKMCSIILFQKNRTFAVSKQR